MIHDITDEVRRLVRVAQQDRPGLHATNAQLQAAIARICDADIGPIVDYMNQIDGAVMDAEAKLGPIVDVMNQLDALIDEEPAPPPPGAQFVSPLPDGAVYGKTKWLPGSLGADFFLPRQTRVVAPADCVIEEIIGGTGLQGGAEMILALPDKSWAWRFRHVQAWTAAMVGGRVKQGETVAYIMDTSLDQLGNPPAWAQPMPDRYQHLDLSVNRGTDQFSPQGGGGGNWDADAWMESLGYQGRVLNRTPGPTDAGRTLEEAITMMGRPQ